MNSAYRLPRVQFKPASSRRSSIPSVRDASSGSEHSVTYQCAPNDPGDCVPDGLDPLQVQFPELFVALDLRDDPIHPNRGIYLSNDFQVANFWGDVEDVRVRPEVRVYVPLHR